MTDYTPITNPSISSLTTTETWARVWGVCEINQVQITSDIWTMKMCHFFTGVIDCTVYATKPSSPSKRLFFFPPYISTTATPLTPTLQSPLRPTGWSHPLIGRWEGHRAEWQRNQRSLEQVRCLACGFLHHFPSARSVCCFLLEDQGSGDLWLQCLKITSGYCMSSKLYSYLEIADAAL